MKGAPVKNGGLTPTRRVTTCHSSIHNEKLEEFFVMTSKNFLREY